MRELKTIKPGEDLIKLVGNVLYLEVSGVAEDLPFYREIGSFKVTASRVSNRGEELIGYDEEGVREKIPIEYITGYFIRK